MATIRVRYEFEMNVPDDLIERVLADPEVDSDRASDELVDLILDEARGAFPDWEVV